MSDLVFERVIPAPAEEVFYAFSTEQGWRDWLCQSARFRPLSGRSFQLAWNSGWFAAGSILTLERPNKVELSWHGPGDPATSRVSIGLLEKKGGTEVEIRHAGLGEGEAWERARAEVQKGWEVGLENLESIFKTGEDLRFVRRPMLGIWMNDFSKEIAEEIGVPVTQGARIDRPVEGMGAERAGLQHDDVLVEMDDKPVRGFSDLGTVLQGHRAGDTIPVTFYRGREKMTLPMELSRRPIPQVTLDPGDLAKKLTEIYAEFRGELEQLFAGVSEEQAGFRPSPDGWSAKDTLAHLIEGEYRNLDVIQDAMQDIEREFADEGGNVRERLEAMQVSAPTSAALRAELENRQRETVHFLQHADKLKRRKGVMWRLAVNWLETPLGHERGHMEQMKAAIQAARAAQGLKAGA
ncbi:MAG TPA: SRPBCC domain-containing protein [Anaerolineales bacterium]